VVRCSSKYECYSHTYLSCVDVVRMYEHTVGGCISLLKLNRESELGSQDGKHKIVFIDDSHVRGCARELTQYLDESCKSPVY